MEWLILLVLVLVSIFSVAILYSTAKHGERSKRCKDIDISSLPQRFVVFDLETTGLESTQHEIIEIGAIRVNRDSNVHETFQGLVRPTKRVPKKITQITGISQEMVDKDGEPLRKVMEEFSAFIGGLPLVAFNAEFDMAFLQHAAKQHNLAIDNPFSCALKMARRAWPGRKSYRLRDLAKDGGLSGEGTHRALDDCKRALIVYSAAASTLGRAK